MICMNCGWCRRNQGRNSTYTLQLCQDRNESPRSPCWRAGDIFKQLYGWQKLEAEDAVVLPLMQDCYERAVFELERHGSLARFRVEGQGWRTPEGEEQLRVEWAKEKLRRAATTG